MVKKKHIETCAILAFACLFFIGLLARLPFLGIYTATGFLVIGLFLNPLAGLIEQLWFKLVEFLAFINGRIFLSLIFFIVLTPLAFMRKIFKNQDALSLSPPAKCLFRERNYTFKPDDFAKPF